MIIKFELKEITGIYYNSIITIDFTNNKVTYIKNNLTIKNETLNLNIDKLTDLIKKGITYWDREYIDNKIVDGYEAELVIYTDNEMIRYRFKNKQPSNYNEFITSIKGMVGII